MTKQIEPSRANPLRRNILPYLAAVALSAGFIVLARRYLPTLPYDYDEAWPILDARLILRGLRPFVDFPHHEPPLHLYLLALSGKVFGSTVLGYRMLSTCCAALAGVVLFALTRPLVGTVPALLAQAAFLFTPAQARALDALPETPAVLFSLVGAAVLFHGRRPWSAYASAAAFVLALLVKPTCLAMVLAAALSLVWAREWRRLAHFAAAGLIASAVAIAWLFSVSDGVFADILRFHAEHLGLRKVGMWSIESAFTDVRRIVGIGTPFHFAMSSLRDFYDYPAQRVAIVLLIVSLLGLPIWVFAVARRHAAIRAFAVLWPALYVVTNFMAVDFASPRYFIPYLAASAFLLAAVAWLAMRRLPPLAAAALAMIACVALIRAFTASLGSFVDPWYYQRAEAIAREHPRFVSFSPMFFVATGTEPGCGFGNPALTYGSFGETFLLTERMQRFRVNDAQLIECLRANPTMPIVVDWTFYFFTSLTSPLREYLRGEGSAQLVFFSTEGVAQWNRQALTMDRFR